MAKSEFDIEKWVADTVPCNANVHYAGELVIRELADHESVEAGRVLAAILKQRIESGPCAVVPGLPLITSADHVDTLYDAANALRQCGYVMLAILAAAADHFAATLAPVSAGELSEAGNKVKE